MVSRASIVASINEDQRPHDCYLWLAEKELGDAHANALWRSTVLVNLQQAIPWPNPMNAFTTHNRPDTLDHFGSRCDEMAAYIMLTTSRLFALLNV